MEADRFRREQAARDERNLDAKVKRWKQLQTVTYGYYLPDLLWEYVTAADDMYIDGHFVGVVLLCACIVELSLADRLMPKAEKTRREMDLSNLGQMTKSARKFDIITAEEKDKIDELRKLRNALIHAKAGEIAKMGKKWYEFPTSERPEYLQSAFYLRPMADGEGISHDALTCLSFTRDLTFKFYGEQS